MEVVSILGCGWLGKKLGIDLIKKGYTVKGSTTSMEKFDELKTVNIEPFLIDISKESSYQEFLETDVLVIAITSKNIEDFKRLIFEIEKSNLMKVIFISSTSVYPSLNKEMTEEDQTVDIPLSHIENLFLKNTNFETTIIRFSGLFGGKRHPGNWFTDRKIPHPKGYVNMIHREDCIAIIEQVIKQNIFGEVFNACANHHPTREDFYINARKSLEKPAPEFDTSKPLTYKIISSKKLQRVLNYQFKYNNLLDI
ncbi:NAD(P)-binding domain-containing protein [Tenacibaculum caenipelagi]|uniref:Nucleoside-diphosphate-sugar epimerase n=1 Tax=Tenacibaculum caenipelagi TaxID=1325435 RepID=A0A4R6TGK6_9FLAO|nr:NAD(P)-binding domain-containing protein [Tenacibaculum caenipelagi]TDQ29693.1 nucleoside-diphosphate-sugar epimerase [Tenacibaculum caenipelagi]